MQKQEYDQNLLSKFFFYTQAKNNFQNLAFNLSSQLADANARNQKSNLKNSKDFKNFALFLVQNPKNLRSKTVYLPLRIHNSSRFTFNNLAPDDKVFFLLYKVNHFLMNNDFEPKFDG